MTDISLLWPQARPTATWEISSEARRDLELEAIVQAICAHNSYRSAVRDIVFRPCLDASTIKYRQRVLQDLQAQPTLAENLKMLLPLLDELTQVSYRPVVRGNPLPEVLARARELELLVTCVRQLRDMFAALSGTLTAEGLLALRDRIDVLAGEPSFQEMAARLPPLLEALRSNASVTIGVNLDHHLRPEAAVLLSVNEARFSSSSLLDRLFGKGVAAGKGVAPLHRPPVVGERRDPTTGRPKRLDPMMLPLFRDLAKVLEKVSAPVAEALKEYAQLNGSFLAAIHNEIVFYVHAHELIAGLQADGLEVVFPEIASGEGVCQVTAAYNLLLALQKQNSSAAHSPATAVVTNDITLGEDGRIAILTGPNQGGKTTYMQAIGLVYILAQIGLPVPGTAARLGPIDAIFTHYPVEERLHLGTGRFGDEAQRLRAIFEKATSRSLVLLNESLATTNLSEAQYVAGDIVRALRQIGLCAVFTTHLHELAAAAEEINDTVTGDSVVFSLVASRPDGATGEHSYRVQSGPPLGRSYAAQIAAKYGISGEQLQTLLQQRALLAP